MPDRPIQEGERQTFSEEPLQADSAVRKEVEEIKEAVSGVISETSLSERVEALRTNIETISEEVQGWQTWWKASYLEALEALKGQVDEIENEWDTVSASIRAQWERLESLLQSFPGIIETSAFRALTVRVTHLEQVLAELVEESRAKSSAARASRQLIASLVALAVTVVLWAVWIGLSVFR